ncbi:MAG: hypothetical protein KUG80_00660 [Gammaproteobacteria bacterium]|nr:hypothetical protein [Gammaproteobacteria bacterium]
MESEQTFLQSVQHLLKLCIFKSEPKLVKARLPLILLLISTYVMIATTTLVITPGIKLTPALTAALLSSGLLTSIAVLWLLHFFKGAQSLFFPALLSIFSVHTMVMIINLPALLFYSKLPQNNLASPLTMTLMLILLGWGLAATGRILHFSLDIDHVLGSAIALSLMFIVRLIGITILS